MPSLPEKFSRTLRVGTRGSALALAQTELVCRLLRTYAPEISIEKKIIQTSGDRFKGSRLAEAGGKGLFVKEIEEALLTGEIDFAVHSLKDLPGFLPRGLVIAATPKREDPRDAFVSKKFSSLAALPPGAKVGTSSPRRTAGLLAKRPDLKPSLIRGNVETRLKKLEEGLYDAILLAAAGLKRLRREEAIREYLELDAWVPAVGQGILAVEARKEDAALMDLLEKAVNDPPTWIATRAERSFLQTFGGDCYTPLGGFAWLENEKLRMRGFFSDPSGRAVVQKEISGPPGEPEELGRKLADEIARHQTAETM